MPVPADGPATLDLVKTHLRIDDDVDDGLITPIVNAVNTRVLSWPVSGAAEDVDDWEDPSVAHIVEGAVMLAARLFRRRNSPDGVAAFGAAGPVYVQRTDPDIALLLQIGAYRKPRAR